MVPRVTVVPTSGLAGQSRELEGLAMTLRPGARPLALPSPPPPQATGWKTTRACGGTW